MNAVFKALAALGWFVGGLAWAIVTALVLSSILLFIARKARAWWRQDKIDRAEIEQAQAALGEARTPVMDARERIANALTERRLVVPIDAETDAEAVEAIIAYSREAA